MAGLKSFLLLLSVPDTENQEGRIFVAILVKGNWWEIPVAECRKVIQNSPCSSDWPASKKCRAISVCTHPTAHGSCQDLGLSWGLQGELCSDHTMVCHVQTSLLLQSKEMVASVYFVIGILGWRFRLVQSHVCNEWAIFSFLNCKGWGRETLCLHASVLASRPRAGGGRWARCWGRQGTVLFPLRKTDMLSPPGGEHWCKSCHPSLLLGAIPQLKLCHSSLFSFGCRWSRVDLGSFQPKQPMPLSHAGCSTCDGGEGGRVLKTTSQVC